jgi:DNA-directed RNA polymerase specialized sigma24 family protein
MNTLLNSHRGETPRLSLDTSSLPGPTLADLARAVSYAPTRQERDAAWRRLEPVVRTVARAVASRFSNPVRQDLPHESPVHVWLGLTHGQFHPSGAADENAAFRSWCGVVIRRYGLDAVRKLKASKHASSDGACTECIPDRTMPRPGALESLEQIEEVERLFRRLRRALDRLAESAPASGQVQYHAVLLVALRQAVAGRLLDYGLADQNGVCFDGPWPCDRLSGTVARWLPWREQESRLRFKAGMPNLGALWPEVATAMDAPPHDTGWEAVARALSTSVECAMQPVISADVWAHWLIRAKNRARRRLGEAQWAEHFARWLPDREPQSDSSGSLRSCVGRSLVKNPG